jgi:hypothetical protein
MLQIPEGQLCCTLTRQQSVFEGRVRSSLTLLNSVPSGQTHGCFPMATTFLSEQVGRQHLQGSNMASVFWSDMACSGIKPHRVPWWCNVLDRTCKSEDGCCGCTCHNAQTATWPLHVQAASEHTSSIAQRWSNLSSHPFLCKQSCAACTPACITLDLPKDK